MNTYEMENPGKHPIDTALPAPAADTVVFVAKAQKSPAPEEGEPDPGPAPACL